MKHSRSLFCILPFLLLTGCGIPEPNAPAALSGDASDAVLVSRYIAEDTTLENPEDCPNPDINADGFADADDILEYLHTAANAPAVPPTAFTAMSDYTQWAKEIGYPQKVLTAQGADGINQDYFHTPAANAEYTSGRIVIGDSRCCQLGIYQQRTGAQDYAVFAVWGGHYASGTGTRILTKTTLAETEACFRAQIAAVGKCEVFLFATVNDYDYKSNNNGSYIRAAVSAAEQIAKLTYERNGTVYSPRVTVIGFEGGWKTGNIYKIPPKEFNRWIADYNSSLAEALNTSALPDAAHFTTVAEITANRCDFISDGLHYGDGALQTLAQFVRRH